MSNFIVGERITINGLTKKIGVIKEVTPKKVKVLLDSTTTGVLSEYSLRNDNTFVLVGYSKDDAFYGGYINNIPQIDYTIDPDDILALQAVFKNATIPSEYKNFEAFCRGGYKEYRRRKDANLTYSQWINGQTIALTSPLF